MKKIFAGLVATLSIAAAAAYAAETFVVSVDNHNDAWSCANALTQKSTSAVYSCPRGGYSTGGICQQGPHGYYGSATVTCY